MPSGSARQAPPCPPGRSEDPLLVKKVFASFDVTPHGLHWNANCTPIIEERRDKEGADLAVRMKDITDDLGVSLTVSKALRNHLANCMDSRDALAARDIFIPPRLVVRVCSRHKG